MSAAYQEEVAVTQIWTINTVQSRKSLYGNYRVGYCSKYQTGEKPLRDSSGVLEIGLKYWMFFSQLQSGRMEREGQIRKHRLAGSYVNRLNRRRMKRILSVIVSLALKSKTLPHRL
jgi:hypothetical protein